MFFQHYSIYFIPDKKFFKILHFPMDKRKNIVYNMVIIQLIIVLN